jgi:hypothetical protein
MATTTLISSVTVGSGGQSSMDFNSISSAYTDLRLYLSMRVTDGGEGSNPPISRCGLIINGTSTGSLYNVVMCYGLPTSTPSANSAGGSNANTSFYQGSCASSNATTATFSNTRFYFPEYANSSYEKVYSIESCVENNATTAELDMVANLWNSTAAITSLSIKPYNNGNFAQYTTAYLYGISKA